MDRYLTLIQLGQVYLLLLLGYKGMETFSIQNGLVFFAGSSAGMSIEKDLPSGASSVHILFGDTFKGTETGHAKVEIIDGSGTVVAVETQEKNTSKPGETIMEFTPGDYKIKISDVGTLVCT